MSSATYRALLRTRGAAAFYLSAAVGRVGIAMTSLGIVWLVYGRTGSYATAGWVTGAFALAEALAGPQLARLADRFGQTRALPPILLAHAAAVALLLTGGPTGPGTGGLGTGGSTWLMLAGGVLAGATIPQLGALSAARWAALVRPADLPTAFSLESLANALSYLAGPVLVSVAGASGRPELGTALAATLVVMGGLALAAQRRTAPPVSCAAERHGAGRTLLRPRFVVLVGVNVAIGVFFGAMQVSIAAFAAGPAAAAPLYAVSSGSGLLAGWLYGLRRWRTGAQAQLAIAAACLALGCVPLLVAGSPLTMAVAIAFTGAAVPPLLVLSSVLAEDAVHRGVLTQAFTWLNSASAAGSAGAAALAGRVVDASGAHAGFAIALAAGVTMTALAALPLRR